jgi:hypothetical protein
MRPSSPRQKFLDGGVEEQEHFENLIRVDKTAYKPGPKQAEIHASVERVKLVRGGLGGGKSRLAGEHVNMLALTYPKSRHLIGRRDMPSLKKTTQHEFLEKVVSSETIDAFNVNDNVLYYKNRSEVHFVQTKTPEDFKSFEGVSAFIDEADENDDIDKLHTNLNPRLRQMIDMDGARVEPPFALFYVFNPCDDQHGLYRLAYSRDPDVKDFRLTTYDNKHNLPDSYIPMLLKQLPAWDIPRLVHGHYGRQIKGQPVYHAFSPETHVRALQVNPMWPLLRGWDFGFNHPACCFMQMDPITGRILVLRELVGNQQYLSQFVEDVKRLTVQLVGSGHPVMDYGDPHGADKKDNAESSIEYLRIKHSIHVNYRREKIKTGMDEIQHKILTKCPYDPEGQTDKDSPELPLWLVDPSCAITIAAYRGGYHRDPADGSPVKDGFYDHICDTHRYVVVHNMNLHLARARQTQKRFYVPRSPVTGY